MLVCGLLFVATFIAYESIGVGSMCTTLITLIMWFVILYVRRNWTLIFQIYNENVSPLLNVDLVE